MPTTDRLKRQIMAQVYTSLLITKSVEEVNPEIHVQQFECPVLLIAPITCSEMQDIYTAC